MGSDDLIKKILEAVHDAGLEAEVVGIESLKGSSNKKEKIEMPVMRFEAKIFAEDDALTLNVTSGTCKEGTSFLDDVLDIDRNMLIEIFSPVVESMHKCSDELSKLIKDRIVESCKEKN